MLTELCLPSYSKSSKEYLSVKQLIYFILVNMLLFSCITEIKPESAHSFDEAMQYISEAKDENEKLHLIRKFEESLKIDQFYVLEINTLVEFNKLDEAKERWNELYKFQNNNIDFLISGARLFTARSNVYPELKEANYYTSKSLYLKALEINKNHQEANYELGLLLYKRGVNILDSHQELANPADYYTLLDRINGIFEESKIYFSRAGTHDLADTLKLGAIFN